MATSGDDGTGLPFRLGIVGCGAITEAVHLPAMASLSVEIVGLSHTNTARRGCPTREFGLHVATYHDYRDLLGIVDAVMLALANGRHTSVGVNARRLLGYVAAGSCAEGPEPPFAWLRNARVVDDRP